jgi:hypothetical protein
MLSGNFYFSITFISIYPVTVKVSPISDFIQSLERPNLEPFKTFILGTNAISIFNLDL